MTKHVRAWMCIAAALLAAGAALQPAAAQPVAGQPAWKVLIPGKVFDHIVINAQGEIVVTSPGRAAYRSKDGGATWYTFIARTDTVEYYGSDGDGSHYAKIKGKGICRSDDDGKTWTLVLSQDMYFIFGLQFQHDLTIMRNGNLVMWTFQSKFGILRSTNKGATWDAYNNGLVDKGTAKVLFADDSGDLIAQDAMLQVYRRRETDSAWAGIDWRFPYPGGPGRTDAEFIARSQDGLLIALGIVGWISRDSGRVWDVLIYDHAALRIRNLNRSMFDSTGNVYSVSYNYHFLKYDIERYTPATDTWQSLWYNLSSFWVVAVNDVAVLNDGTVFAATDEGLYVLKTGVTGVSRAPAADNTLAADVYPAPAGDAVTLALHGGQYEDLDVSVCTLLGTVRLSFTVPRGAGAERLLRIGMQDLPAGPYLLSIRGSSMHTVIPLLKN